MGARGRWFVAAVALFATAWVAWRAVDLYWLCDDAFISFRYARQLVEGRGLVFNAGERVEGYTNFLWVLEVAAAWAWLGVRPEAASVALSAVCTAGVGALTAWVAARTPARRAAPFAAAAALVMLAANRSFAVWVSGGLETRQFTLFVVLAVALLGVRAPGPRGLGGASLALAGAALTRPEGLLVAAVCFAFALAFGPRRGPGAARSPALLSGPGALLGPGAGRSAALLSGAGRSAALPSGTGAARSAALPGAVRSAALLLGPFALLVGAHLVFRRAYYGDWLPNTYYAKHVRAWTESGDRYLVAAALEHGVWLAAPFALWGAALRRRLGGDRTHALAFAVVVPHALYVRHVGGDHFEFRPLDPYWPLLAPAVADGLVGLYAFARRRLAPAAGERAAGGGAFGAALLAFGALVEYGTVLQRAFEALTRARVRRADAYRLYAPVAKASTAELARLPFPEAFLAAYRESLRYCVEHHSCTRQGEHRALWRLLEEEYGPYRALDRVGHGALPPDAVWARDAVGVAPYFFPTVAVIDQYGLTDRVIARTPAERPNGERVMAHDRRPPPGYLEARGVNVDVGAAARSQGEALARAYWALRLTDDVWMPFLSPSGDWVERAFAGRPLFSRFEVDGVAPAGNAGWVEGRFVRGVRFVGRFDDGGADGWAVGGEGGEGAGCARPVAPGDGPSPGGAVGGGWLSTRCAGPGGGDERREVAFTSPAFEARGALVFRLAGGDAQSGVELAVGGRAVRTWRGDGSSDFRTYAVDLGAWAGAWASIVLFDRSRAASVALDHVVLAEDAPE